MLSIACAAAIRASFSLLIRLAANREVVRHGRLGQVWSEKPALLRSCRRGPVAAGSVVERDPVSCRSGAAVGRGRPQPGVPRHQQQGGRAAPLYARHGRERAGSANGFFHIIVRCVRQWRARGRSNVRGQSPGASGPSQRIVRVCPWGASLARFMLGIKRQTQARHGDNRHRNLEAEDRRSRNGDIRARESERAKLRRRRGIWDQSQAQPQRAALVLRKRQGSVGQAGI